MYRKLTSRGALAATSGLVAAGVALVFVLPMMSGGDLTDPGLGPIATETTPPATTQVPTELASNPAATSKTANAAPSANQEQLAIADSLSAGDETAPADSPDSVELAESLTEPLARAEAEEVSPVARLGLSEGSTAERPAPAPVPQTAARPRGGIELSGSAEMGIFGDRRMAPEPFHSDIDVEFSQSGETEAALPPIETQEAFPSAHPGDLNIVAEDPVSTFSIDVDTASYAIVRNSLMSGTMPPRDAVRPEEMINYFPYAYTGPEGDAPFATQVTVTQTPWNAGTQLIHIGLQGALPQVEDRPPLNLVFLIDSSGSMQAENKLPLLKQSLRMMLPQLRPEDEIAIVTYAGNAGQVLAPTSAADTDAIYAALDRIQAGGSTAGQAGLQQAYRVAEGMAAEGEVSRVLLATDGDFNVGLSNPDALKTFIASKRDTGTYLSVLGFGRGNLNDATMQALAQNGNGQAAYIDTLNEARKVLVDQLTGALFPIANDVKIQVEFNPATVAEYRLIGYETRALRRQDFNNDRVDAGEIGAGHRVTALYEVTPVGSSSVSVDPLRYGTDTEAQPVGTALNELGFLRLRYKAPGADASQLIETPISTEVGTGTSETRFATAIAGFAQLLKGNPALQDWSYADAIALATDARGEDRFGYRAEAIQLMRLAESLSQQ